MIGPGSDKKVDSVCLSWIRDFCQLERLQKDLLRSNKVTLFVISSRYSVQEHNGFCQKKLLVQLSSTEYTSIFVWQLIQNAVPCKRSMLPKESQVQLRSNEYTIMFVWQNLYFSIDRTCFKSSMWPKRILRPIIFAEYTNMFVGLY